MPLLDLFVTKWIEARRLNVQPDRCVRTRNRFSTCHKCAQACPVSAISLENGLKVNEEVCHECMKCTVSCPTEALYDNQYMQSFKEMQKREVIAFSCDKDKSEESHIKLGCLGQLDKALLIQSMVNGKKISIQFNEERCLSCYKYDGLLKTNLEKTINELNLMLKDPIDIQYNEKSSSKMERSFSRRELFSFFSKKVTRNVVSPLLPEDEVGKNLRIPINGGSMRSAYHHLLEKYQNKFHENQQSQHLQTLQLAFNENCDGCKVCAHVCPTGALKFTEQEALVAMFSTQACNGCRACIDICRKNGLQIDDSPINLVSFLDGSPKEIFVKEEKNCSKCGEKHYNSTAYCDECAVLQRRFS